MHFTSNILMISPEKFRSNEFTMNDNVFQSREIVDSEVSIKAIEEFEKLKNTISDNGVSVYSLKGCLLYTSPSPRDRTRSRMPSSA